MKITRKEIAKILIDIKSLYPYAHKDTTEEEVKVVLGHWTNCLERYDKHVIAEAFKNALMVCKLPPSIADIVEQINLIYAAAHGRPEEVWASFQELLYEVWTDDYGRSTKQFEALPPILKKFCGGVSVFISIAQMNNEQLNFERVRFLKEFPHLMHEFSLRSRMPKELFESVSTSGVLAEKPKQIAEGKKDDSSEG